MRVLTGLEIPVAIAFGILSWYYWDLYDQITYLSNDIFLGDWTDQILLTENTREEVYFRAVASTFLLMMAMTILSLISLVKIKSKGGYIWNGLTFLFAIGTIGVTTYRLLTISLIAMNWDGPFWITSAALLVITTSMSLYHAIRYHKMRKPSNQIDEVIDDYLTM